MATTTSSSTLFVQNFLGSFHSRRLLQPVDWHVSRLAAAPASGNGRDAMMTPETVGGNAFDTNVVMVLSVLLCALICSLGLNSIIRCALRCSNLVVASGDQPGGGDPSAARLANTGIKKKALKTFPTISYTNELKLPGLDAECVICLSEFAPGERVRVLPKCHHGFHVRCIDKWLNSHSSCPTCRHCLIETCQKIVGCAAATPPATSSAQPIPPPPPAEPTIAIRIEPLPREGLISNHQN